MMYTNNIVDTAGTRSKRMGLSVVHFLCDPSF